MAITPGATALTKIPRGASSTARVRVNPSKPALQTLKMCNLLPLFDIFAEEPEAVQSYS